MPQGIQPKEESQNYGRQITKIESEEILAKTGDDEQRQPKEKPGYRSQAGVRQKTITQRILSPPPIAIRGERFVFAISAWGGARASAKNCGLFRVTTS